MLDKNEYAELIARRQHANMKYGDGSYAQGHLEKVVALVSRLEDENLDHDILIQSAWLHDVVEDTDYTLEEIESFFGSRVSNIVSLLTHDEKDNYVEYLLKICRSQNLLAVLVKYAGMTCNLKASIPETARAMKYKMGRELIRAFYAQDKHNAMLFDMIDGMV